MVIVMNDYDEGQRWSMQAGNQFLVGIVYSGRLIMMMLAMIISRIFAWQY